MESNLNSLVEKIKGIEGRIYVRITLSTVFLNLEVHTFDDFEKKWWSKRLIGAWKYVCPNLVLEKREDKNFCNLPLSCCSCDAAFSFKILLENLNFHGIKAWLWRKCWWSVKCSEVSEIRKVNRRKYWTGLGSKTKKVKTIN